MRRPSKHREVACDVCGQAFMTNHSQGKYCSGECAREGAREAWRKYGERNRDRRRQYHRKYYEANKDEVTARVQRYHKSERGKAATAVSYLRMKSKYPEKVRARGEVLKAIRKGVLVKRVCEVCGSRKSQAHHDDYSKPLSVRWLCQQHHADAHRSPRKTLHSGKVGIYIEDGEVKADNRQPA